MKKYWVIAALVFGVVVVGGLYAWQKGRQPEVISPEAQEEGSSETAQPVIQLLTWDDPNGFTFQYPEDVDIDKHDEDQVHYAHIELTHKKHEGTIIVWAKDTTAPDAASFVKGEKSLSGSTVFDTTLAGLSGKKALLTTPKKTIISAVVDQGVVYYVEGMFDASQYWTDAYDTITASFAFASGEQNTQSSGDTSSMEAVDEEEIIE